MEGRKDEKASLKSSRGLNRSVSLDREKEMNPNRRRTNAIGDGENNQPKLRRKVSRQKSYIRISMVRLDLPIHRGGL